MWPRNVTAGGVMSGVRCVAPVGDITGEGVVWSADEGAVYWTDINRFLIHRMNGDGSVASWYFDEPVTALGLTDRPGTLIAALASRLILWWPRDDWRETLGSTLADWPEVRFNDGRPDPLGGFVVGTMGNNVGSDGEGLPVVPGIGKLFRFTPEGGFATIQEGIGISNTICWSSRPHDLLLCRHAGERNPRPCLRSRGRRLWSGPDVSCELRTRTA